VLRGTNRAVTLILTSSELNRAIATRMLESGGRVVAVIDDHPSTEAIARLAAELAAQHNCRFTIVVTWDDRSACFLVNPWVGLPFTSADVADWNCESASERARALMIALGGLPGFTYYCRKGRTKAVARALEREYSSATIVVGVAPSVIGRRFRELCSSGRHGVMGVESPADAAPRP
jgi:hypothetical protein